MILFRNIVIFSFFILPVTAQATILSGTITNGLSNSSFVKLSVPFSDSSPNNTVGNDNFQNNNLYGFDEDQNVTLTAAIAGLASGSTVASHYIFFDPDSSARVGGTVTFDSDIVAVLRSTNNLAATDYLANTGVIYENPSLRGLESSDSVSFSGVTLTLDWTASTPGDYVRVLTNFSPAAAAVPEPSALALMGLGLLGFSATRRKQ